MEYVNANAKGILNQIIVSLTDYTSISHARYKLQHSFGNRNCITNHVATRKIVGTWLEDDDGKNKIQVINPTWSECLLKLKKFL